MLKIYNAKLGKKEEFQPLTKGEVSIYLCGPTVQSSPHIGHIRSAVAFDIIIRWLKFSGYKVTYIRNITDINDKIFAKAAEANSSWWQISACYANEFRDAYKALGCLDPTYEPLASAHINQMVDFIRLIMDKGYAYSAEDGVYFDTSAFQDYGLLTNQSDENSSLSDQEEHSQYKRNVRDFALWKLCEADSDCSPASLTHPAFSSPWGMGRPGWHLECSAMAKEYLGGSFDIHGGGLDLRFPHHENELAQSRAAGFGFTQRWIHSSWVTQKGEKMSKSLGNTLLVSSLLRETPAHILRFALGGVHYRSQIEFSRDTISIAEGNFRPIQAFLETVTKDEARQYKSRFADNDFWTQAAGAANGVSEDFAAAMDDDFNMSLALAEIHKQIKSEGNRFQILAELDILGFASFELKPQPDSNTKAYEKVVEYLMAGALKNRAAAKANKDFALADSIRNELTSLGVAIEDLPDGETQWKLT